MREFGSEHPAVIEPDGYFENLTGYDREVTYLRSGREALLYVSLNCKPDRYARILFPAYCCWSMSAPFEKTGWEIVYYRLNEDLTVDEDYLSELIGIQRPDAVLTMNFYGSASTANVVAKIKRIDPRIVVIEDFSHCTFDLKRIFDAHVDYYVSSIRKSIGVSDGAVVLSRTRMNREYIRPVVSGGFSPRRRIAQIEKDCYAFQRDTKQKERFLSILRECEHEIDEFSDVRPISDLSMRMLSLVNGARVAFIRRENMKHLWSLLNGKVRFIAGLERCFDGAPFSLPILAENRDELQMRLAERGVYAPVLWPICRIARETCSISADIADHILSIPIDQRYDWDDMEDIARIITDCI